MFSEPQGSEINEPLAQRVQQRAIMEAAVCTSVMHPNVVATYHYDLTPSGEVNGQACEWKLYLVQVNGGYRELCTVHPVTGQRRGRRRPAAPTLVDLSHTLVESPTRPKTVI
eukprot:363954-Chlamydomonas_euryale.AAC.8